MLALHPEVSSTGEGLPQAFLATPVQQAAPTADATPAPLPPPADNAIGAHGRTPDAIMAEGLPLFYFGPPIPEPAPAEDPPAAAQPRAATQDLPDATSGASHNASLDSQPAVMPPAPTPVLRRVDAYDCLSAMDAVPPGHLTPIPVAPRAHAFYDATGTASAPPAAPTSSASSSAPATPARPSAHYVSPYGWGPGHPDWGTGGIGRGSRRTGPRPVFQFPPPATLLASTPPAAEPLERMQALDLALPPPTPTPSPTPVPAAAHDDADGDSTLDAEN